MLVVGKSVFRRALWWMIFCVTVPAWSGVERVEILQQEPFNDGLVYGAVGSYEVIYGRVHFTLSPECASSQIVSDLQWARTDKSGMVHYSSDFYLLRPLDGKRGNGSLLVDIPNRGNTLGYAFNFPFYPMGLEKFSLAGDGFLFKRGFTIFGIGWQADVVDNFPKKLKLHGPAVNKEKDTRGLVRSDIIFTDDGKRSMGLGHWSHEAYPALIHDRDNQLTVRDTAYGRKTIIPRSQWTFGIWENGVFKENQTHISLLKGSFEKGRIYEAVYASDSPKFIGLGLTAVRDAVSYLRHNPESPVSVERVIGFGASQTARFLRHFLYHGMNVDLENRLVLDGFLASVAGAGRGSFHHPFAQPSRFALPFSGTDYPSDQFPFSDTLQKDPFSGKQDGIRSQDKPGTHEPKIIYLNTGYEYWNRATSLIHTTIDGKKDLDLPANTRYYHIASASHLPHSMPPSHTFSVKENYRMIGQHEGNPINYFWCERALLKTLDDWVAGKAEPPPSRFPTIRDGSLVQPNAYTFPTLPGVRSATKPYAPVSLDYGPYFQSKGIIGNQPPLHEINKTYPVLVPKTDIDGNELGGIRLPEVAVPVGTFTPWNWRSPQIGAPDKPTDLAGSFFPFARTRQERLEAGDPRLSLEERYKNRHAYLGRFVQAALPLIRDGYLMAEDLPHMIDFANQLWDLTHEKPGTEKGAGQ